RLHEDMTATMAAFRPGVETLEPKLATLLAPDERERVERVAADLAAKGVPQALADRMATFPTLFATLDIVEVAAQTGHPMEMAAAVYFDLAGHLGISWLRDKISALPGSQHWQMLAKGSMLDDLSGLQRAVTAAVLAGAPRATDASAAELVKRWQSSNDRVLERAQQLLGELRAVTEPDSAMLSVMLREMRRLG
ncbi:MAG: NAD-glutamate dehydrogenase, partial [Burkholderiaceae bacterium]